MTMVKIWFCKEGKDPTGSAPAYELSFKDCVEKLGLASARYLSDLSTTPRFGDPNAKLAGVADYRHVVAEISEADIKGSGWKSGFYLIELSPQAVIDCLGLPNAPWRFPS